MVDDRAEAVEPGGVAQHLPNRDVRLAVLGELGPIRSHAFVVVQLAAVGEHMGAGRGDALGRAPAHREGVTLPRVPVGYANAAPKIHDQPAAMVDGDRGTAVGVGDLIAKNPRHFGEIVVVATGDYVGFRYPSVQCAPFC